MKKRNKILIGVFIVPLISCLFAAIIYTRTNRKEAGIIEMESNDASFISETIDKRNKELSLIVENKTKRPETFIVEFYDSQNKLIQREEVVSKRYKKKVKVAKNELLTIKIVSPSDTPASFTYLKKTRLGLW